MLNNALLTFVAGWAAVCAAGGHCVSHTSGRCLGAPPPWPPAALAVTYWALSGCSGCWRHSRVLNEGADCGVAVLGTACRVCWAVQAPCWRRPVCGTVFLSGRFNRPLVVQSLYQD